MAAVPPHTLMLQPDTEQWCNKGNFSIFFHLGTSSLMLKKRNCGMKILWPLHMAHYTRAWHQERVNLGGNTHQLDLKRFDTPVLRNSSDEPVFGIPT